MMMNTNTNTTMNVNATVNTGVMNMATTTDMKTLITEVKFNVGDLIKPNNDIVGLGSKDELSGLKGKKCIIKVTEVAEDTNRIQTFKGELVAHEDDKFYSKTGKIKAKDVEKHSFLYVIATEKEVNALNALHKPAKKGKSLRSFKEGLIQIKEFDDGTIESSLNIKYELKPETDPERVETLKKMLNAAEDGGYQALVNMRKEGTFDGIFDVFTVKHLDSLWDSICNFFMEYGMEMSLRFPNTIGHIAHNHGVDAAIEYVRCYFECCNAPDYDSIKEKIKSQEFREIVKGLSLDNPENITNERLAVWYSAPGTGKTTKAERMCDYKVNCHAGMTPDEFFVKVRFTDEGSPVYLPSLVVKAYQEGKSVVLDEGNLLPYTTLKGIQSITDNSKAFSLDNTEEIVKCKKGFKIIITMNLRETDGIIMPLPAPIVDRAYEILNFKPNREIIRAALL